jgi:hypothetical protein
VSEIGSALGYQDKQENQVNEEQINLVNQELDEIDGNVNDSKERAALIC